MKTYTYAHLNRRNHGKGTLETRWLHEESRIEIERIHRACHFSDFYLFWFVLTKLMLHILKINKDGGENREKKKPQIPNRNHTNRNRQT